MVNYKKKWAQAAEAQRLIDEDGYTVREAAKEVGVSTAALYKYYGVRKSGRVPVERAVEYDELRGTINGL